MTMFELQRKLYYILTRKPRVVRIAELAYPDGDVRSQAVATEFAAECIKTLLDALANK